MATDQTQVLTVVGDLRAAGAGLGARLVLFNAVHIAQREAAEVGDLPQTPAVRLAVETAPHPHAANDHSPASSSRA